MAGWRSLLFLIAFLVHLLGVAVGQAVGQGVEAPAGGDVGAGGGIGGGFGSGGVTVGGYVDNAVVINRLRFRFDAAYDNPSPDRVEFFYPQCTCSGGRGPAMPETGVDFQEVEAYLEVALNERFSTFVEVPVRFINPEVNANHSGLSDIRAGFKSALIAEPDQWLTFQVRGYFPTGDGDAGLGTRHVSIEPGLLFQTSYDRLAILGEVKAWVPVSASKRGPGNQFSGRNFAGTVMRYGLGVGYDFHQGCGRCGPTRSTLVTEVVGWTILDGLRSDVAQTASAVNDTIVNLKVGVRSSTSSQNSVYVGYGRALTGDVWYQDILRAEYEFRY